MITNTHSHKHWTNEGGHVKPHAEQQGQLTGSGTIGHALIKDVEGLPAIVRRRQSSPSSPQKA